MPFDVHTDDMSLSGGNWDHILTAHGDQIYQTFPANGPKSRWYTDDGGQVAKIVSQVFTAWKSPGRTVDLLTIPGAAPAANGRTKYALDLPAHDQIGTGADGKPTTNVRLVLQSTHSGATEVVTAFPV